jgi:hypothetical protein
MLSVYAYAGSDPIEGVDPTGTVCVYGINETNDFCSRSLRYVNTAMDKRISSRTNFFVAAAAVTNALGGSPQSSFMKDLSASLETANMQRANQIRDGHLYSTGSVAQNTKDFVTFEQNNVQKALDAIKQHNPDQYQKELSEQNASLNGNLTSLAGRFTDPAVTRAIALTQQALGRSIDFGNQSDREALGNAIAGQVSRDAPFCTGSHVVKCN